MSAAFACLHVSRVDWGSVPAWIATATVFIAASGYRVQKQVALHQIRRDIAADERSKREAEVAEDLRTREQARQVRVHILQEVDQGTPLGEPRGTTLTVQVINESDDRITQIHCDAEVTAADPQYQADILKRGLGVQDIDAVAGKSQHMGVLSFMVPTLLNFGMINHTISGSITFTDVNGLRWRRDNSGALMQLPQD
jgi:hypothetical protein